MTLKQKITKLFTDNHIREPAIEKIMGYFEEEREAIATELREIFLEEDGDDSYIQLSARIVLFIRKLEK